MKFANIDMLFLIWLVPVLAAAFYYGHRKRRRILASFTQGRASSHIVPQGLGQRRRRRTLLVLAALLLAVTALAGPQYGFQWQTIEQHGIDLMVVLDCSRSMLAGDIQPTRLERAKRKIYDLLNMLEGDRVGLTAFGGTAFLQCPLTLDYQAFHLFLDVLGPDYLPVGGSDLAAAVSTAAAGFDPKSAAEKAVILITDGEHTVDSDPVEAARAAHQAGITLFCIGVGSDQAVPIPASQGGFVKDDNGRIVLSRLDETLLALMAAAGGGLYVRSTAGDLDLETIYRDRIRAEMVPARLTGGREQVRVERFQWPLALALGLLFAALWIPIAKGAPKVVLALLLMPALAQTVQAGALSEGYQAYQRAEYDQALKKFIDGQLKDPENPEVLYNIGNSYYKTGNFRSAEDHYRHALESAAEALRARLRYNLGNAAYRQGKLQEAHDHYAEAVRLAPDDVQARENLAFVRQQLQQQQGGPPGQPNPGTPDRSDPPHDADQVQEPADGTEKENGGSPSASPDDPRADDPHRPNGPVQQPSAETAGSAARPAAEQMEPQTPSAADQALQRLKDEPGRAMMPNHRKRRVDKDW